jgi:hypothetical protein
MFTQITARIDADDFHRRLYSGEIFLFRSLPAMQSIVRYTQNLLERTFPALAPPTVHSHLTRAEQAKNFAAVGREFTRSSEVKALWRALFASIGLDLDSLARDRLRLRSQPPLSDEEAPTKNPTNFTVPFHRDTWGTNLYAQINWWAPVYPISAKRTMALYPTLWDRPLRNSTASYDLEALVKLASEKGREAITGEMAVPHVLEPIDPGQSIPVVMEPGSVLAFSGAHAHAGVPNSTDLTRFSMETRTVWIPDVESGIGAPNVDGAARWMAPGFFYRLSDGRPLHDILGVARLEPYHAKGASP